MNACSWDAFCTEFLKKHVFLKLRPTKGSRYIIYAGNTMAGPFCGLMDLSD